MFSQAAIKHIRNKGVLLFRPDNESRGATLVELSNWQSCHYKIYYSINSDQRLHIFNVQITVMRNAAIFNDVQVPDGSDLIKDEACLLAMTEYLLDKAKTWTKRRSRDLVVISSRLPRFNFALAHTGYEAMNMGTLNKGADYDLYRGRYRIPISEEILS